MQISANLCVWYIWMPHPPFKIMMFRFSKTSMKISRNLGENPERLCPVRTGLIY